MTDRYDQLGPIARALVDDYDALDLAEMLVKAQDQLAALRQVARGYCPDCGRGDAAPTVQDWEREKQRANSAEEAERRMLAQRQEMAAERYAWQERGDRAEALLAEVLAQFQPLRPEHDPTGEPGHWQARVLPYEMDAWQKAATTGGPASVHVYLSTGCLHDEHDYCSNAAGIAGPKKPAQCKFCAAPCQCPCHHGPAA